MAMVMAMAEAQPEPTGSSQLPFCFIRSTICLANVI